MRTRLLAWWDALRSSYWFVPTLLITAAALSAAGSVRLDERFGELTAPLGLFAATPEGARAVLTAVAAAMVTLAGLTFSLTIVALTLASQQFGPRLLRNFMRDTGNQVVLGTFIAVFLYCLLVLGTVRGAEDTRFVPSLAVTLAVAGAVASLGILVYFIHHVSTSIHASQIVHVVGCELDAIIDQLFPAEIGHGAKPAPDPPLPAGAGAAVHATASGYLQAIDGDGILAAAVEADAVVRLDCRPGDLLIAGDPVARIWTDDARRVTDAVIDGLLLGPHRTALQDLEFAIDQLVEVAVRALSPGVNDPVTAMTCIDRLAISLCRLASRTIPASHRLDANGRLRLVARGWTFAGALDAACDQIRQYGRGSVAVSVRQLEALAAVAARVHTPADAEAVRHQAEMIARGAADALPEPSDRDAVRERLAAVHAALARAA